jgi:hypothetical protein
MISRHKVDRIHYLQPSSLFKTSLFKLLNIRKAP